MGKTKNLIFYSLSKTDNQYQNHPKVSLFTVKQYIFKGFWSCYLVAALQGLYKTYISKNNTTLIMKVEVKIVGLC